MNIRHCQLWQKISERNGIYHRESVEELFCKYEWQNEELITVKGFNNKVLNNFYFSFNFNFT